MEEESPGASYEDPNGPMQMGSKRKSRHIYFSIQSFFSTSDHQQHQQERCDAQYLEESDYTIQVLQTGPGTRLRFLSHVLFFCSSLMDVI